MPATGSPWLQFSAYRRYEATRQEANNAMTALLAGSRLAAHTLQLTEGSTQLLPDIFPGVDHINYFSLRTDRATALLNSAGHHLGAVAIPYALAVHEDFVMTVLDLLASLGYPTRAPGSNVDPLRNRVQAWNMHEAVWLTLGQSTPVHGSCEALEHFHFLREMRNVHIHAGGVVDQRLIDQANGMSAPAVALWTRRARRAPSAVIATGRLEFTTFDIFVAFATAKSLGRVVNHVLRDHLAVSEVAKLCLDDYLTLATAPVRSDGWMRGLIGHAARNFAAKPLTEQDVFAAAIAAGYWTSGKLLLPRRGARGDKRRRNPGVRPT